MDSNIKILNVGINDNYWLEIEKFVDEICDLHYINESYFGNIMIALEEGVSLLLTQLTEKKDDQKMVVEFVKRNNRMRFLLSLAVFKAGKGKTGSFKDISGLDEKSKDMNKNIFLLRSLTDEWNILEGNKIELIFNYTSINQETILKRRSALIQYFQKQHSLA